MDKSRKYLSLKCEVCNSSYKQQERVFKKAKWKNRCPNHRGNHKKYYCKKCNKEIFRGSTMCKSCCQKKPRKKCIDCNKEINIKSKLRCISCHNKNQDKGKSKERTKFNASKKWKNIREKAFIRDNYTCQICNKRGSKVLNGHHIKSYVSFPDLRLDVSNIATLCEACHNELHHKKEVQIKHPELIHL